MGKITLFGIFLFALLGSSLYAKEFCWPLVNPNSEAPTHRVEICLDDLYAPIKFILRRGPAMLSEIWIGGMSINMIRTPLSFHELFSKLKENANTQDDVKILLEQYAKRYILTDLESQSVIFQMTRGGRVEWHLLASDGTSKVMSHYLFNEALIQRNYESRQSEGSGFSHLLFSSGFVTWNRRDAGFSSSNLDALKYSQSEDYENVKAEMEAWFRSLGVKRHTSFIDRRVPKFLPIEKEITQMQYRFGRITMHEVEFTQLKVALGVAETFMSSNVKVKERITAQLEILVESLSATNLSRLFMLEGDLVLRLLGYCSSLSADVWHTIRLATQNESLRKRLGREFLQIDPAESDYEGLKSWAIRPCQSDVQKLGDKE